MNGNSPRNDSAFALVILFLVFAVTVAVIFGVAVSALMRLTQPPYVLSMNKSIAFGIIWGATIASGAIVGLAILAFSKLKK